ncbi:hypothetical protein AX17_002127 [Amanita inopinata Kibby_2008]|nr:hypothetical protein AX17_002127 [Amanita inopinata Kibby_2008]
MKSGRRMRNRSNCTCASSVASSDSSDVKVVHKDMGHIPRECLPVWGARWSLPEALPPCSSPKTGTLCISEVGGSYTYVPGDIAPVHMESTSHWRGYPATAQENAADLPLSDHRALSSSSVPNLIESSYLTQSDQSLRSSWDGFISSPVSRALTPSSAAPTTPGHQRDSFSYHEDFHHSYFPTSYNTCNVQYNPPNNLASFQGQPFFPTAFDEQTTTLPQHGFVSSAGPGNAPSWPVEASPWNFGPVNPYCYENPPANQYGFDPMHASAQPVLDPFTENALYGRGPPAC